VILCAILLSGSGCNVFEFSPYETDIEGSYKKLNETNIARLLTVETASSDSFTFAFLTDSHADYDDFLDAVTLINGRNDILFVLHGGDITDFGLQEEYKLAAEIITRSQKPFITAIGNHDCLSNGRQTFRTMFGDSFFSFEFPAFGKENSYKFVFLNDNTLEHDMNDNDNLKIAAWVEEAISSSHSHEAVFVVAHVPPDNTHYFNNETEEYYRTMLSENNVLMSLNGHEHKYYFGEYYDDGVLYLSGEDIGDRQFVTITVHNGEHASVTVNRVYY